MFDRTLSNSEARVICPMSEVQMRNMMRACGFKMAGGWYISENRLHELIATGVAEAFKNNATQIGPVYAEDWISFKSNPPAGNGEYFVYTENGTVRKATFKKGRGFMIMQKVTHWLPLPKTPAREG